ncbi:tRNA lysidine(34) synthetase TilS [Rhodovulum sp. 12E13]|uniref:tRNA lysidine(34) synthetase TilS n=1 Tax=Rhodovulum sp. 12E13 TaxID=2203891 RepID=UPI001F1A8ACA|nr:tRNA lysidine(34) synthetase TilS [Rhodovulum sp. 12E13]
MAAADPGPKEAFATALARAFPGAAPEALGLAVSGGSDSMALMALAADWASARGTRLEAVTVDHGLRPEAADEARMVANAARALGLPHRVLVWQWDRKGNLQDAARRARFSLLAGWAVREGLAAVLLGHTRNDQAETLLMRLARGSGVDGLAAMAEERVADGVRFLRPLLDVERYALRQELNARGQAWADDPTNDDPAFDRVRTRRALAALGLDDARLAETAARMADARAALEEMTRHVAASSLALDRGDLTLPQEAFATQPAEIRHRLLAHLLRWRAHSPYRPRYRPLRALAEGLVRGRGGTLHGCFVSVRRGTIRIAREYAAVAALESPPDALWDGFWQLERTEGAARADTVRALGQRALGPLPDTGHARPPRESLMASPALWHGDRLVAAPLAGLGEGWTCQPAFTVDDCLATLLSH